MRKTSISYCYVDKRDRTIHCDITFRVDPPDSTVGFSGEIVRTGHFVTEVVLHDGNRVKTSDNRWWDALDAHAEDHLRYNGDIWRDLAYEEYFYGERA